MKRTKEQERIALSVRRLKAMRAAKISKAELARLAGVTWTMAYLWCRGLRTSANLQRAFEKLVHDGKQPG